MDREEPKKNVVLNLASLLMVEPFDGEWELVPLETDHRISGSFNYGELRAIIPTTTTSSRMDGYGNQRIEEVKTTVMGLFRRSENEIIKVLKAERDQAVADRDAARIAKHASTSEIENLKKKLEEAEKILANESEACAAYVKEVCDANKRAQRYEQDIAKLRTALGDLRMKEILGS